jgi:hypothetical protein
MVGGMDEFDDSDFDNDDAFGEGEHRPARLDRNEAAMVRRDLDDLASFRQAFEPEGFKGVSLFCADCVEEHFYEWDMLEHNLTALLESGETPVHEPAFDPRPDEYVDWEYAQGYLDGLADAGAPAMAAIAVESGSCPFCGTELPEGGTGATFCQVCGQHLGPARIAAILIARGWSREDVAELLQAARVPPTRGHPGHRG